MIDRNTGARGAIALGIVSVLAIGLLTAQTASARTKTSYYTATVDQGSNDNVRYATASTGTPTEVTFTITNCGTAFAPPSSCDKAKGTNIDSVAITLPSGWTAADATTTTLTATNLKLAPGASVSLPVEVYPSLTGAGTAQSLTSICVSDATACSYQPATTNPTLTLPLRFTFASSPAADGTAKTALCGTQVQLTDGYTASPTDVPIGGVAVTLAKDAGSLDPAFSFDITNTPKTDANGLAAFDAGSTTDCPPYPAVGGPYSVIAVGHNADGVSIPSAAPNPSFTVFSKLNNSCGGGCQDTLNGDAGATNLSVNSHSSFLGIGQFDANVPAAAAHYPTFSCGSSVKKVDGRPDILQVNSDGDKTVVITWSKQVTLKFTDNGTPHWQVCMEAPAPFITDSGDDAVANGDYFVGTIPLCGAAFLQNEPPNPCVDISRKAAQEIATITLPVGWAGDPYFH